MVYLTEIERKEEKKIADHERQFPVTAQEAE